MKKRYYNDAGKELSDLIENNKTIFFTNHKKASDFARENKSYSYRIYSTPVKKTRELIGFGVPI